MPYLAEDKVGSSLSLPEWCHLEVQECSLVCLMPWAAEVSLRNQEKQILRDPQAWTIKLLSSMTCPKSWFQGISMGRGTWENIIQSKSSITSLRSININWDPEPLLSSNWLLMRIINYNRRCKITEDQSALPRASSINRTSHQWVRVTRRRQVEAKRCMSEGN